jgi:hypothetical protein
LPCILSWVHPAAQELMHRLTAGGKSREYIG